MKWDANGCEGGVPCVDSADNFSTFSQSLTTTKKRCRLVEEVVLRGSIVAVKSRDLTEGLKL